jgi:Leucine-rich repeat (LRR) protein
MTGVAFGRELECYYKTWFPILWSSHKYCHTLSVDYSAKFENEKHSFSGNFSEKSELKTFYISRSAQLEFIPRDILTEFPNLNGLVINQCNLPTLRTGLFKADFDKIEHWRLESNKIELIQPGVFQNLNRMKWISLDDNNLQTLPHRLFKYNPNLVYISLANNQINSIHPNFFEALHNLKMIDLRGENVCIQKEIGCSTCRIF